MHAADGRSAHVNRSRFERLFDLAAPLPPSAIDGAISYFDDKLEDDQKRAVQRGLSRELSLVLGPPGTGKTRTLAELVRQAVARGERVLVTAASHTAVDNLAERLVRAGVRLVRIGHPARVSEEMESHTLDALLEATDSSKLAEGWVREAEQLRQRLAQRMKRGAVSREERSQAKSEINGLFASARRATKDAQRTILHSATVIAATAAGADSWQLDGISFDRVVLDEATQAPDPIALVALLRATKVVMAGDPFQLPPTVIAKEAVDEGLSSTLFERLADGPHASELVTLLRVQHRMHAALMAFPNQQTYSGQLRAAPEVAEARLESYEGVRADEARPGPLVILDSAGRGWDEEREDEDPSTRNPSNAARIAAEVRRLISRGVKPSDIGVITPYNAQVRWIRDALDDVLSDGLEVSTVDGFQGREKLDDRRRSRTSRTTSARSRFLAGRAPDERRDHPRKTLASRARRRRADGAAPLLPRAAQARREDRCVGQRVERPRTSRLRHSKLDRATAFASPFSARVRRSSFRASRRFVVASRCSGGCA